MVLEGVVENVAKVKEFGEDQDLDLKFFKDSSIVESPSDHQVSRFITNSFLFLFFLTIRLRSLQTQSTLVECVLCEL